MKKKIIISISIIVLIIITGILLISVFHNSNDFNNFLENDVDYTNGQKSVEEINEEYANSNNTKPSEIDSVTWSYSNLEWNPNTDSLNNDEYGYIVTYVLNIDNMPLYYKDILVPTVEGYSSFAFSDNSTGITIEYEVLYSDIHNSIYVYAYTAS